VLLFFSGGAFLSSTTSNVTNPNAVNEKAFSIELGYGFKSKYLNANINIYRTNWIDKTLVRAINANTQESLVVNMQGVNALHQGVEAEIKSSPTKNLELTGMLSVGDWHWQNNATGYLFNREGQPVNANGDVVESVNDAYQFQMNLEGIKVGNSAQTTVALGLNYQILKGFKIGIEGDYFGRNYSYFNISSASTSTSVPTSSSFSQPWEIPDAVVFNAYANYKFKIGTYEATLIGNIDNLFNNEYITDATDGSDHTWKTASVLYGFGRTWSTTLKIKF